MADDASTEEEILDAAYTVLVERGYDDFTTQAVANEAGKNQSLVHYYFETKHDLVLALLDKGLAQLKKRIARVTESDDPTDRLLSLAEYMIETPNEESLAFKRVLLGLTAQAPYDEELRDVLAYDHEQLYALVAESVREGIEAGHFHDVDPDAFAATYLAAIRGAQYNAAVFGIDADDDLVIAGFRAIIHDYLVEEDQ